MQEGKSAEVPIYDFAKHSRSEETHTTGPADVIVVEGILVLAMQVGVGLGWAGRVVNAKTR